MSKNEDPITDATSPDELIDQSFRDSIGTLNEEGKRNYIFPKKPSGKYTNYRQYVSYVLLAIFFGLPFIEVNGHPFMMLNVLERKFIIFGQIFWPADFLIFVLAMLIGVVFIAVFTVAFGRLFCGWVCPQTIFMEHVFRRIEYWIEGDRRQQLKLTKMPWNAEKIRKKGLKNLIFYGISFLISNFFLMYVISFDDWRVLVTDDPREHMGGLSAMLIFSGVFYFVFAWFREQVCIIVCPYGRLQGALLDRNSIVIAYDYLRGEKRGKYRKKEDRAAKGKGDCIDCYQCVDVCPTGIDIRNGTQLECINCTACIDACDAVMRKINRPEGLIRYDSENNIASGKKKIFTPRVIGYAAVLAVLMTIFSFVLFSRSEVEAIVTRVSGSQFERVDENTLANTYNYKLINKTANQQDYSFKVIEPGHASIHVAGDSVISVPASELTSGAFLIYMKKDQLEATRTKLKIGVFEDGRLVETIDNSFSGPLIKPK